MEKIKFTLTDRFGDLVIFPIGVEDMAIEYSQDNEDSKRDYNAEFSGSLTLKGEAFDRLMRIEKSVYRCSEQFILIERLCVNVDEKKEYYKTIFSGVISLNNAEFDLDACYINVNFNENTAYKCIEDNAREKRNILNIGRSVDVMLFREGVKLEKLVCYGNSNDSPRWCGPGDNPKDGLWVELKSEYIYIDTPNSDLSEMRFEITYCREVIEISCNESAGDGWMIVGTCSNGKQKYAREASLDNCKYSEHRIEELGQTTVTYECEALASKANKTLRNGRSLDAVFKYLVTDLCGISVVSDFFQINPENTSLINYVTRKTSVTNNVILFQKSDVKRPEDANRATKGEITFEDLMEFLKTAFNADYRIENGSLRVEHVSFFNKDLGLDLTQKKYDRYTTGTNSYHYLSEDIPALEKWQMKEGVGPEFSDAIIYYSGGCVTNKKKNEKEYIYDDFTTDVEYVMANPESDSKNVNDAGFVVISAGKYDGKYFINSANAIAGTKKLNNVFSTMQLVSDYQFYERPLIRGRFNGQEVLFKSSKPIKKGAPIEIPYCCNVDFEPLDYVKTALGNGVVEKAAYNINQSTLELDLLYQAESGLELNDKPSVSNYARTTYLDIPIIIDLLQNAKDPQGDETVISYRITREPTKGILERLNQREVRYIPREVGQDNFLFVVYDEWGEDSDVAICSITTRNTNTPPSAVDDYYEVYSDEPLIVNAANGLFANDSDDYGFSLFDYDKVSEWGRQVIVQGSGAFRYNTVEGKFGTDTFKYTIVDEQGLKSTATVFILVKNRNQIVTNDNKYFTSKGMYINATGEAPNATLIANDISPAGEAITALEEIKSTENGGSVNIKSNGTFTYTPRITFVGEDKFTYTAKAGSSSAVGNVSVNVVEELYVTLSEANMEYQEIVRECNHNLTSLGSISKADFVLRFYKDAQKTIPFDVTGLGLKVKIKEGGSDITGSWDRTYYTSEVSGSTYVLLKGQVVRHQERMCDSHEYHFDMTFGLTLEAGQGYKI